MENINLDMIKNKHKRDRETKYMGILRDRVNKKKMLDILNDSILLDKHIEFKIEREHKRLIKFRDRELEIQSKLVKLSEKLLGKELDNCLRKISLSKNKIQIIDKNILNLDTTEIYKRIHDREIYKFRKKIKKIDNSEKRKEIEYEIFKTKQEIELRELQLKELESKLKEV